MNIVDLLSKNEQKRRVALDEVLNKLAQETISTTAPLNLRESNYKILIVS